MISSLPRILGVVSALFFLPLGGISCNQKSKKVATEEISTQFQPRLVRPDSGMGSKSTPTLEALALAVSQGLYHQDTTELVALTLSDSMYRSFIWPKTKGYHATNEKAFRFIRGMHHANSLKGLRRRLWAAEDSLSGLKPGLKFEGIDENSLPGVRVVKIDDREPFAPFGSAVEIGGQWQVLSFGGPGVKDVSPSDPE
jgi:hypothetical protein